MLKPLAVAVGNLLVGAALGFGLARLYSTTEAVHVPGVLAGTRTALALSDRQVDALADRIAPAIARRLVPAANKPAREAAFEHAAQIVDLMIANRRITHEGLNHAHALLRETGQTDRSYEVHARIAAAINRGELTLEQAGWGPEQ